MRHRLHRYAMVAGLTVTVIIACVLVRIHDQRARDAIRDLLTPLVVGSASLLVTLSARNQNISDRLRNLTSELRQISESPNETSVSLRRIDSVVQQINWFGSRFAFNHAAFVFQFFASPCVVGSYLVASAPLPWPSALLFGLGCALFVVGAAATALELSFAPSTLAAEQEFAVDLAHELRSCWLQRDNICEKLPMHDKPSREMPK